MTTYSYRDLDPEYQRGLEPWAAELGEDMRIAYYDHDGKDTPDQWADGPHLALQLAGFLTARNNGKPLAWPVDYEGWANPRDIGWYGVLDLLNAGKRE